MPAKMLGVVAGAGVLATWNAGLVADTITAPTFTAATGANGAGGGTAVEIGPGCGMLHAVHPAVALKAPLSKPPSLRRAIILSRFREPH